MIKLEDALEILETLCIQDDSVPLHEGDVLQSKFFCMMCHRAAWLPDIIEHEEDCRYVKAQRDLDNVDQYL